MVSTTKDQFLTFCETKPFVYSDILRNQFETIKIYN